MSTFVASLQQRRAFRRSVDLPCQVIRERDFTLVGDRAFDISPRGMRVEGDSGLGLGDALLVAFRATDLGIWFHTDAKVVRIEPGRREGDTGPAYGIEFQSLDHVSRLLLRGAFKRRPPPLPRRNARMDYAETVRRIALGF
ncbi:MAG: PilZ domain-containing protein [Polyangiaceae bacterium]